MSITGGWLGFMVSGVFTRVSGRRGLMLLLVAVALGFVAAAIAVQQVRAQDPVEVDAGDVDELIAAIEDANESGDPTIITLTSDDYPLPLTVGHLLVEGNANITIEGSGATIQRDSSAGGFRIFLVDLGSQLHLNEVTITGGQSHSGGGIYNLGTLTLTNSTVSGNSAVLSTINQGGGIYNGGTLTLTNSTVSDNVADNIGGGIVTFGGTLTLTNSTVSGNEANFGGGIYNGGSATLTLTGSLVAGNTGNNGPDILGGVGSGSSYNLVGNGSGMTGISEGDANDNIVGVDVTTALDPNGLQDNGGPTETIALIGRHGNPAINHIPEGDCTVDEDQRGVARPQGASCDIGAYEFDGELPAIDSIELEADDEFPAVGADVTITATVLDENDETAGANIEVSFAVSGGNAATADPDGGIEQTDRNGEATFIYTNTTVGVDTITATVEVNGDASEETNVEWLPGPPHNITVNVDPDTQTVGEPVTLSAEVIDEFDNHVADGTEVTFEVEGDGDPALVDPSGSWTAETQDGAVAIEYTNTTAGIDTITATVEVNGDEISDDIQVTWQAGRATSIDLAVEPDEQDTGDPVTVTAVLTDEYDNLVEDGTSVTFAVSREESAELVDGVFWDVPTTDGVAELRYTNHEPGTETIAASTGDVTAMVTVTWLGEPDPPDDPPVGPPPAPDPPDDPPDDPGPPAEIDLTVEPGTQVAGMPATATATITDDDGNVVDVDIEVTFSIERDGEAIDSVELLNGEDWTVETDGGEAEITFTNTLPGTDTVTATADDLEDTATVEWISSFPDFDHLDADDIENEWFWQTWARTDLPVRDDGIPRTWMWGPGPFTESMTEPYAESPDGEREVIYFDKSRMEINHPDADSGELWYVTNGLLVMELITGERQFGDETFEDYGPAHVNVAGDPDDPDSPTYASFSDLLDVPAQEVGTLLTQRLDRDGTVTDDNGYAGHEIEVAYVDEVTDHGIASPFWDFMNSEGTVYEDGDLIEDDLFENPFYATGRPVTEAYWATIRVDGEYQDVLVQAFERRVLTYTPGNDEGWQVEAGNVGQHYYYWRYVQAED